MQFHEPSNVLSSCDYFLICNSACSKSSSIQPSGSIHSSIPSTLSSRQLAQHRPLLVASFTPSLFGLQPPPPPSNMGNCVCMQGPGHSSRSKKRAISSGGGDSVKPFLNNASTVHPLASEDADVYQKETAMTAAAGESKVVRLKMVLTKAEVARLFASGTVDAAMSEKTPPEASVIEQLVAELQRLSSTDRTHEEPVGCGSCSWRPALESIPEVM